MISSMENIVEVTPTSPPGIASSVHHEVVQPQSPEIRVTDSPASEASSSSPESVSMRPLSSPGAPASTVNSRPAPLIFQPFLPLPGAIQRCTLPFSIDNILKPNFGGHPHSVPTSARSFLHANPAFFSIAAAAAAVSQQQQRSKVEAAVNAGHGLSGLIPERQRSPSSSSSSNGSLVKSEIKSPPSSPILNHNNNCQPVDLSQSKSDQTKKQSTNQENSPSNGSSNTSSNADGDLPPGMVRGPNGQLWPAWVFCTRYSDRPSSGKFENYF